MKKLAIGIVGILVGAPASAGEGGPAVAAVVASTMPTEGDHIRQLAFDGDPATFFATKGDPGAGDGFVLVLDEPVSVKAVAVLTGRPDGSDRLDAGSVEASSDGTTFREVATFRDGSARSGPIVGPIKAIRVRPAAGQARPLAIREVAIDSTPKVATFRYPVEFAVDVSDSPEMKPWAEGAARLCERWYGRINDELKTDGFKPARRITMRITPKYEGVAATSGGRIIGSTRYFQAHPGDLGAMIHETAHVVQDYRGRDNPGWLVEGVADYVRFFKYEPGKIGPIDPRRARYDASYRTTAAFLNYAAETYDKALVLALNKAMREGTYREAIFEERTGKTARELDEEWRKALGK